ncbi:MAG: hypothetical protein HC876_06155 [Chloroflexaceae bacterium]|nr:hypothetical protein [Chloroflexaceae bacterium]NJO05125.1 hypothetical protein [Chloroflexaceae bacterium]
MRTHYLDQIRQWRGAQHLVQRWPLVQQCRCWRNLVDIVIRRRRADVAATVVVVHGPAWSWGERRCTRICAPTHAVE